MKRRRADLSMRAGSEPKKKEPRKKRVGRAAHPPGAASSHDSESTSTPAGGADPGPTAGTIPPPSSAPHPPPHHGVLPRVQQWCTHLIGSKIGIEDFQELVCSLESEGANRDRIGWACRVVLSRQQCVVLREQTRVQILQQVARTYGAIAEEDGLEEVTTVLSEQDNRDAIAALEEQHRLASVATDEAHRKALEEAEEKRRATQLEVEKMHVECAGLRRTVAQLQADYAASQTAEAHLRTEHARVLAENATLYAQNAALRLQRLAKGGGAVEDAIKVEDEA